MKITCAWCGAFLKDVPEGTFPPGSPVSHGICQECSTAVVEELGIPVGQFLSQLDVPLMLVSDDVRVVDVSPGALAMLGDTRDTVVGRLGGDVFECVNSALPGGCGRSVHCSGCVLRGTVTSTWRTGRSHVRIPATLEVTPPGAAERQVDLLVTTAKVGSHVLLRIDSPDPVPGNESGD